MSDLPPAPYVTLLTDFGTRDGAAGLMKGVIWRIAPTVQIADISHTVGAQNLQEAAIVLRFAFPYFPRGSVHCVVVDPGVGTTRRSLAARCGDFYFVGPDNGVCTPMLVRAEAEDKPIDIVAVDQPQYWLPEISNVFHGRDVYSPVAAHLAAGVPLHRLGTSIDDPIRLELAEPTVRADAVAGEIIFVDDFGNLHTNILDRHLDPLGDVQITLGDTTIDGLVRTFGERPPGTLIAHYGTEHDLCISVVNGDAMARLQLPIGTSVDVRPSRTGP